MFNARSNQNQKTVVVASAAVIVAAGLSLAVAADQRPVEIDIGQDAVLTVGLRLNQYAPVSHLPSWLELPNRSTSAYVSILPDADSKRLYFRSLSSSRAIEAHFRQLLLAKGFQLAFVRPSASVTGVASIITAFDSETARSVQITVREGRAVRSVEVQFRGAARVASKGLSIGS